MNKFNNTSIIKTKIKIKKIKKIQRYITTMR
jgi:hypothetical protein